MTATKDERQVDNGGPGSPQLEPRGRVRGGTLNTKKDRVWVTSDLHLGHVRIIELCNRPFTRGGEPDVAAMNQAILDGINSVVMPRDHLIILGDVIMGKFEENVKLLRTIRAGRITIIPGNHDRTSLAYPHHGSAEVARAKRNMFRLKYEEARARVQCFEDRTPSSWPWMVGGVRVAVSHYPYRGDSLTSVNGDGTEGRADRYVELRPVDRGLPLVHGHVHNRWSVNGRMFNVGVDVNGFKPVSEDELGLWAIQLPLGQRIGVAGARG